MHLHIHLFSDFTLSLLKLPKEGSADKPPATLATSSDNVFTFGKDDNPEVEREREREDRLRERERERERID
eukprot:310077-Amorphochlora_amoeboformis.AAC.1